MFGKKKKEQIPEIDVDLVKYFEEQTKNILNQAIDPKEVQILIKKLKLKWNVQPSSYATVNGQQVTVEYLYFLEFQINRSFDIAETWKEKLNSLIGLKGVTLQIFFVPMSPFANVRISCIDSDYVEIIDSIVSEICDKELKETLERLPRKNWMDDYMFGSNDLG